MELDFSVLDAVRATERPEPHKAITIQAELENARTGAHSLLEREAEERERARQVYKAYQYNTLHAGELRAQIAKGVREGRAPLDLFLMAVHVITLITGDTGLEAQLEADVKAVYGWGLRDKDAVNMIQGEIKERIARLEENITGAPTDAQKRIESAIHIHKVLLEQLSGE